MNLAVFSSSLTPEEWMIIMSCAIIAMLKILIIILVVAVLTTMIIILLSSPHMIPFTLLLLSYPFHLSFRQTVKHASNN